MFLIATLLVIAAGTFYAASITSSGWALQLCNYGDLFCAKPSWLAMAAVLAVIWACFMRVDRL